MQDSQNIFLFSHKQFGNHSKCNLNRSTQYYTQVPIPLVQQQTQVINLKLYEQKWDKKISKFEEISQASYLEKEYIWHLKFKVLSKKIKNQNKIKFSSIQQIRYYELHEQNKRQQYQQRVYNKEDNLKVQMIELYKMIIQLQRESSKNKIEVMKWKKKYIEINKLYNEQSIEKQKTQYFSKHIINFFSQQINYRAIFIFTQIQLLREISFQSKNYEFQEQQFNFILLQYQYEVGLQLI